MSIQGRVYNCNNYHQGKAKRVLCVCSAGLLRSPTAAHILSAEPFNFNTRSAGIEESYALIVVDEPLLRWADEIICVDVEHYDTIKSSLEKLNETSTIIHLVEVEDHFGYRDPTLVSRFTEKFWELYGYEE